MKVLAKNRRATFDYQIKDRVVAGIALLGPEVKSVKAGRIDLTGSYVTLRGGEAYLIGSNIAPYAQSRHNPEPQRSRKLLLHRREIERLAANRQSGWTAVPLAVGLVRGLIKIEIGVGQGKKKQDKRQAIKQREAARAASRAARRKN